MPEEHEEERLDRYLVRVGIARSRREAREMVERGAVRVNARKARKGEAVGPGDHVEVEAEPAGLAIEPDPEAALEILFEDAAVIVVNKPGGVPCHPLGAGERGTVMNAVVARYPETATAGDKPREGGLVHRLDNGTSGALLVARNPEAFAALRRAIRTGAVKRRYLALVGGHLARPMTLQAAVAHHPRNARRMVVAADESEAEKLRARRAVSRVEPIRPLGDGTLVQVLPTTGSRHQIRVHLANAGFPIVGDTLYGGAPADALGPGRFWLHLSEIEFDSPVSGTARVKAPLPVELKALIEKS